MYLNLLFQSILIFFLLFSVKFSYVNTENEKSIQLNKSEINNLKKISRKTRQVIGGGAIPGAVPGSAIVPVFNILGQTVGSALDGIFQGFSGRPGGFGSFGATAPQMQPAFQPFTNFFQAFPETINSFQTLTNPAAASPTSNFNPTNIANPFNPANQFNPVNPPMNPFIPASNPGTNSVNPYVPPVTESALPDNLFTPIATPTPTSQPTATANNLLNTGPVTFDPVDNSKQQEGNSITNSPPNAYFSGPNIFRPPQLRPYPFANSIYASNFGSYVRDPPLYNSPPGYNRFMRYPFYTRFRPFG